MASPPSGHRLKPGAFCSPSSPLSAGLHCKFLAVDETSPYLVAVLECGAQTFEKEAGGRRFSGVLCRPVGGRGGVRVRSEPGEAPPCHPGRVRAGLLRSSPSGLQGMGSSPAVTLIRREIPGFCQPHSVILCSSLLAGRPGSPCVPLSRAQGSRCAWLRGQHGPLCDPFGFGSGARFLSVHASQLVLTEVTALDTSA